ncbi:thiopeptide-type bacteriocin biosynthesis protein [Micromonospora sp. SL1-18]|uniref:thiopeptide-type bacteriocin biosynthesis protein n=1 Tax=Micromonospora sp. SL1-18 TaxID=3399128 RepID=UPI003A4D3123
MASIPQPDETLTATTSATEWRALHVSVPGGAKRLEELLLDTVDPWMAGALAAGDLSSWFLNRPCGGSGADAELRLRLCGADDKQVADLSDRITAVLGGAPERVVEHPYKPDLDRFGGPYGMAVAAEHFAASTTAAVAAIRATRSPAKRLRAAGELLLASVLATGADWRGAVRLLREYACTVDAPPAEIGRRRAAAEAAYLRSGEEWLRFHEQARAAAATPNTTTGTWSQLEARTWSTLVELHAAGRLDAPPEAVFRSLIRATHNRLGLHSGDEAYLAWLLSMPLAAPGPRVGFFADGPDAVDRRMHEQGKYYPTPFEDQRPDLLGATSVGRQELGEPLATIALPRPAAPPPSAPRFEEVLLARRSSYGRYGGPFSLDELSTLLYYAAAETTEKPVPGTDRTVRLRTYPSGGGRYPLRLVLYCHDIDGLRRGTYLYDPAAHALNLLSTSDISAELAQLGPATDPRVKMPPKAGGKADTTDCPLWVLMVADLTYQRLHYGLKSYRLVMMESGHLGQNLSLAATWLGKSCAGIVGYFDDAASQLVGVDGVNSAVVYVYFVGVARPATPEPPPAG